MPDFNPYEAPEAPLEDWEPARSAGEGPALWAEGSILVVRDLAKFPDRCVKCNEPAEGRRLKRVFRWHPPGWYVLIISPLIYIVVAMIVQKTIQVRVGICPRHLARRRTTIALAWLLVLVGIALMVVGGNAGPDSSLAFLIFVGILTLLGGLIFGVAGSRFLTPDRIDNKVAWLKGASPKFLDSLPKAIVHWE